MKKNLLIGIALLLSAITSCTKDEMKEVVEANTITTKAEITDIMTIETDTVGQIADKVGDRATTLQKLVISGPINAADVETIRNLPKLVAIDMKDATIVGGDTRYTVYVNNYPQTYAVNDYEIGERMFCNTQLSEIILPDNTTRICAYAFHSLKGSAEYPFTEITIPDKVEAIDRETFVGCSYLEKVVLPASLQSIAGYTFYGCGNLTTIEIKNNVTSIGNQAFYECTNLQSITLPEGLTSLGGSCFAYSGLTSITIPNNVTEIGGSAFRNCKNLQSVTLPEGLTSIANSTFEGCSSLASITFPETLQAINSYAFSACESLSDIELPSAITRIEDHAFSDCKGLQTVTFNYSLNNCGIGTYAFANSGVVSVTFTDNVKNIDSYCFENCTSLTTVSLPNSLTTLNSRTFWGCTALEIITIPSNVATIGADCFNGCSKLSNVKLPDFLEIIEEAAFKDCISLKEIDFTNTSNLKEIGYDAFTNTGLIDVVLPNNLETIEYRAFSYCSNLENITIPASLTSVGFHILEGCDRITSIFWNASIDNHYNGFGHSSGNCLIYISADNINMGYGDTKIIKNGVCEELYLASSSRFFVPQEFKVKKISFSNYFNESYKTMFQKSSRWESIILPFTVTKITHSDGRILAPFNADVADAKPFWLRRLTANGFENVTQIEAGIPYIIAMPNNYNYDSEYNISGNVTFSAEDPNGITIPVTGDMVQDAGPSFILHANYETVPMADNIYVLNEAYDEDRPYGSVFVRNERDARPFEGYVTPLSTAANAPAFFSLDAGRPATRSAKPLGPVPSIDDM